MKQVKNNNILNRIITGGYLEYDSVLNQDFGFKNNAYIYKPDVLSEIQFQRNNNTNSKSLNFNQFYYSWTLTYNYGIENQSAGGSWSPIFDKNLNLIGILWGGNNTFNPNDNHSAISKYGGQNIISYFCSKIKFDYFDKTIGNYSNDTDKIIENYNVLSNVMIQGVLEYSYLSQIKRLGCLNTYLTSYPFIR